MLGSGRWPIRVSYANVVASLALFISLGCASYAAISPPANSVGARQLRKCAVGLGALGFPLHAASATDYSPQKLPKLDFCNVPGPPGSGQKTNVPPREARSRSSGASRSRHRSKTC
jgi:hypothetical protein